MSDRTVSRRRGFALRRLASGAALLAGVAALLGGPSPADARKLVPQKPERIVRPSPQAERPGLRSDGDPQSPTGYDRPHHLQIGGAPPPVFERRDVERRSSVSRAGGDTLYIRVAVIRVEFATDRLGDLTTGDGRFLRENPDPDRIFIDPAPHDEAYFAKHLEAVDRYWTSMTWGCVRIVGDVYPRGQAFGSYELSDLADYGPENEDEFFSITGLTNYSRESLLAADADPDLDWSEYDVYFVVHAGADWQNDIFQDSPFDLPTFSIVFSDSDLVVSDEGDTLETMITYPESASQDGFLVALNGGIAHEMGHQLGLFDIYNVETFASTVAFYDVMDSGTLAAVNIPRPSDDELVEVIGVLPTSVGAWSRWFVTYQFGIHPEEIKETYPRLKLRAIQSRVDAFLPRTFKWAQLPVSDTEYFLLENRVDDLDGYYQGGFDTALDQDDSTGVVLGPIRRSSDDISHNYDLLIDPGVLIWHIDERQALANISVGRGLNVDFEKRSVTIEEADGLVDIGNPFSLNPQGTPNEAFHADNNANFTPFTRPNSNTNLGPSSGISVLNIGPRDTTVTMDLAFGGKPPGWPMEVGRLGTGGRTSTTAADTDGDGQAEIAVVADSLAWLFRYADGDDEDSDVDVAVGAWPVPGAAGRLGGRPTFTQSLGDLDGDGQLELVVASDSGVVHAWTADGSPFAGADSVGGVLAFPAAIGPVWSPVPADLDGDEADELYLTTIDGWIQAWDFRDPADYDELFRRDLLVDFFDSAGAPGRPDTLFSTFGFGDFDGDDRLDGLVSFVWDDSVRVQRFDRRGRRVLRLGWPLPAEVADDERSRMWLGFADIDRDPSRPGQEIVLASEGGWIQAIDGTGTVLSGWPVVVDAPIGGPPAFGDLDGDGLLEIAMLSGGRTVHAFNYNGTQMPGWPLEPGLADFPGADRPPPGPAIADVDGDGRQDVVAGFSDFTVRAFDREGALVPGFPLITGAPVSTTPAILDANGDGRLDLFVQASDGHAYGHILGGLATRTNPAWGMFLGGPRLHGAFDDARLPEVVSNEGELLAGPVRVYPNPARSTDESISVRYTLGADLDERTGVEVVVYNVAGEEILTRRGSAFPNTENLVSLPVEKLASGVYFCRLRAHTGAREETRLEKFAVVR